MKCVALARPLIWSWLRALVICLSVICAEQSLAQKPPNITQGEMARLPPYCPDTMGFDYGSATSNPSPRADYWIKSMGIGPSFWVLHHYCWAMIKWNRGQIEAKPDKRKYFLIDASGDFGFVFKNARADLILLPEIYLRYGEVQLQLSDVGGAHESFAHARKLKPDYWPAYSKWAEFLIKSGLKAEAKKLVAEGLEHAPDSAVLRDQFKLLGGNLQEIKPSALPPIGAASGAASKEATLPPADASVDTKKE